MSEFNMRLEDVLNFLHECLVPETAEQTLKNPEFASILSETIGHETIREKVEKMAQMENGFLPEYIQLLREVRDHLIAE